MLLLLCGNVLYIVCSTNTQANYFSTSLTAVYMHWPGFWLGILQWNWPCQIAIVDPYFWLYSLNVTNSYSYTKSSGFCDMCCNCKWVGENTIYMIPNSTKLKKCVRYQSLETYRVLVSRLLKDKKGRLSLSRLSFINVLKILRQRLCILRLRQ